MPVAIPRINKAESYFLNLGCPVDQQNVANTNAPVLSPKAWTYQLLFLECVPEDNSWLSAKKEIVLAGLILERGRVQPDQQIYLTGPASPTELNAEQ